MFKTIIITCGISLFSPHNSFGNWTRSHIFFQFNRNGPYIPEAQDEEETITRWYESCCEEILQHRYDPKTVCAEYSLLHALKNQDKLDEIPHIKLFYTHSTGGITVSKLLEFLFKRDFHATVEMINIEQIDVSDEKKLILGIAKYMKLLSAELIEESKDTTCFAPIGGYKVLTSFGYIIGAFHGFPTAYLHEDSQVLHTIPPVPLKIDETFIQENHEFLQSLYHSDGCHVVKLDSYKRKLVEEYSYFFERRNDWIMLNPFGLFILHNDQTRRT